MTAVGAAARSRSTAGAFVGLISIAFLAACSQSFCGSISRLQLISPILHSNDSPKSLARLLLQAPFENVQSPAKAGNSSAIGPATQHLMAQSVEEGRSGDETDIFAFYR